MSSYWAGYHGVGLLLSEEEFENLLNKYNEVHNIEIRDVLEKVGVRETALKFSQDEQKVFSFVDVTTDDADGFYFAPYKREDGSFNTYGKGFICQTWRDHNFYALFSDHNLEGAEIFIHNPYPTYEHLVEEIRTKINAYVPNDFNWDAHIGRISYAAYA